MQVVLAKYSYLYAVCAADDFAEGVGIFIKETEVALQFWNDSDEDPIDEIVSFSIALLSKFSILRKINGNKKSLLWPKMDFIHLYPFISLIVYLTTHL